MNNKEFREIQVSSSLLVVIFLGVLALGVFIFLLGVSVGKKQVRLSSETQVVTQQLPGSVKEPPLKPTVTETKSAPPASPPSPGQAQTAREEPAPKTTAKEPVVDKASVQKTATQKKASVAPSGLYYVQVLAVADRSQAQAAAAKYRSQGLNVIIVDPPAGETNFKVRVGGFPTKERATELRNRLNAAAGGRTDFWIVRY